MVVVSSPQKSYIHIKPSIEDPHIEDGLTFFFFHKLPSDQYLEDNLIITLKHTKYSYILMVVLYKKL